MFSVSVGDGIIIREPGRNVPLHAVNGRCTQCAYRMAWIVIRGGKSASSGGTLGHSQAMPPRIMDHV
jgi:hypothetical protein